MKRTIFPMILILLSVIIGFILVSLFLIRILGKGYAKNEKLATIVTFDNNKYEGFISEDENSDYKIVSVDGVEFYINSSNIKFLYEDGKLRKEYRK